MRIRHLNIHDFRNLCQTEVQFSSTANFIFGDNAQGKTNIIEAIYILCLAKSFRTHNDTELVPFEKEGYAIEGAFQDESDISYKIQVGYAAEPGKKIKIDGKPVSRYSSMIGRFPIVALTSEDQVITTGAPAQRRKFFNILLSQCSARYLADLKSFERILKQRNELLNRPAAGQDTRSQLEIWNEQFVTAGCNLMRARDQMVREMNGFIYECYQTLTRSNHTFHVTYQPNVSGSLETMQDEFKKQLHKAYPAEKRRGMSLVGPHRDEFLITVNDRELRRYGSRGEHKSALVSLKAAESALLSDKAGTKPILLLDDLYSELDINRGKSVMDLFSTSSQTFITGTSMDYQAIKNMGIQVPDHRLYFVEKGIVSEEHGTFV